MIRLMVQNTVNTLNKLSHVQGELANTISEVQKNPGGTKIMDRLVTVQNSLAEYKNIVDQTWSSRFLMKFSALYQKEKAEEGKQMGLTKSFEPLIRHIMEHNKKFKITKKEKSANSKIVIENVDVQ